MKIAEKTQSAAKPGTIRCSDAARAAYLASAYRFDAEDEDDGAPPPVPFHALSSAIFPHGDHHSDRSGASPSVVLGLSGGAPQAMSVPTAASTGISGAAQLGSGAHQTSASSDGGGSLTHCGSAEAGKARLLTFTVRLAGATR